MLEINNLYKFKRVFDSGRDFLFHMGFFNEFYPDDRQKPSLQLLNQTLDYKGLLDLLDSEYPLRRSIKIGVIYIKNGQYEESTLLKNFDNESPIHKQFLNDLG